MAYILVINPGSTSTKIALFDCDICVKVEKLSHSSDEIKMYKSIYEQKNFRKESILNWLKKNNVELKEIIAVVGRGGLLRPMPGGTYKVTQAMIEDLKIGYQAQHASNLGGIISKEIADEIGVNAYIVDPVAVDEIDDLARISGIKEIYRRSLVHALNIKAVTRRICKKLNKDYNKASFVIAHLGGGISVASFKNGKIVDVNNANEEGPFSPERAGGLPVGDMAQLCFSGKYTYADMKKILVGEGGLVSYLGTNDGQEVENMINRGDKYAELIFDAMAYQIAKEIGAYSAVLNGKVDAIIITGGLAYSKRLIDYIKKMVDFIAPVEVVPGEDEMLALAEGALRVINEEEKAKIYEEEVQIDD